MKIAGFIVFLGLFITQVSFTQSVLNKRIDFSVQEKSIPDALVELSRQTAIPISFSEDFFHQEILSNLDFKAEKVKVILTRILEKTNVDFRVIQNSIILFLKDIPPPKFTISGYVEDVQTGERLIAANIMDQISGKGTSTNIYGFFSLTIPAGKVQLICSYLGYQIQALNINLESNQRIELALEPFLTLEEIVVIARDSFSLKSLKNNGEELPLNVLRAFPQLGGEGDVIRFTHMLPGVQIGADGVGGIHVRGGSADQNLILLDGVPVYNATHAVGVFSIFNSSAIRSAQLYKGHFPARYAGRLSSVLDIRTKEGNQKNFTTELQTGVVGGRLTLEGPIVKDKGAFFFAGRRSYLDFWLQPYIQHLKTDRNSEGNLDYSFFDLNGKVNYSIGSKDQLYLSYYQGGDDFFDETFSQDTFELKTGAVRYSDTLNQTLSWGNRIGALRWNRVWGDRLFSNLSLTYSNYKFTSQDFYNLNDFELNAGQLLTRDLAYQRFQSTIEDLGAKIDFDYQQGEKHNFLFGLSYTRHKFQPGVLTTEEITDISSISDTIFQNTANLSYEGGLYVEDLIQLSEQWSANLGLHLATLGVAATTYWSLQPRLALRFQPKSTLNFTLSGGRMTQYLHLLTNSDFGLPADLWVPSTENVRPEEAWQLDFQVESSLFQHFELGIGTYFKHLDNMLTFQTGSSLAFIDANNWEEKVTQGSGRAYGLELQVRKVKGKSKALLSYALARSERNFPGSNNDATYPFRYDRRHDFKAVFSHRFNDRFELTGNWVYGTGLAFTLATASFEYIQADNFIQYNINQVSNKNGRRLPAYHRMDIGANWQWRLEKSLHKIHFGFYNIYDRENPLYYRLGRDPDDFFKLRFFQVTILPLFPNFSYTLKLY